MKLHLILAAAAATVLSGCLHPVDTANAPSFGRSVAANIAAQTEPVRATNEAPQSSGAVGARAVDTYTNAPDPAQSVNLNITTD